MTTVITGTDFITISTKDFDRAAAFYGETLGLPELKRWGSMPAAEFETGNLTIAVMQSDAFGSTSRPTTTRWSSASTTSTPPRPS